MVEKKRILKTTKREKEGEWERETERERERERMGRDGKEKCNVEKCNLSVFRCGAYILLDRERDTETDR